MMGNDYDVAIIGGGVIGSSIARYLSRYDCRAVLLEKEEDVCSGTSKANSAIVHAGHDAKTGSLKARLNVKGNAMMGDLAKELDFDFKRNGSLVLCFSEEDRPSLEDLYHRGVANGVPDLEILTGEEVRRREPNVSDEVVAALWAPTGGIVCPFGLTIALAENACNNGVEFRFNTEVKDISKKENGYKITTNEGEITATLVVNAAGTHSDVIHNMVSERKLQIIPRRGDYLLMDKEVGGYVTSTIFQLPGKYGKGILVTPTVHGNLLAGPTAIEEEDPEGTATTAEGLAEVTAKAVISVKNVPFRQTITSFAGVRAHEAGDDFVIGEVEDAEGFFDAAGIESPGLSCAPAIGELVSDQVAEKGGFSKNPNFNPIRKGIVKVAELPIEERAKKIEKNPAYGAIVCRCENISEGEIVDSIQRTLGARSMDGIKRRVRQGMGRCQAGFCTPRAMEILSREAGIPMEQICKNRKGSELIRGEEAAND